MTPKKTVKSQNTKGPTTNQPSGSSAVLVAYPHVGQITSGLDNTDAALATLTSSIKALEQVLAPVLVGLQPDRDNGGCAGADSASSPVSRRIIGLNSVITELQEYVDAIARAVTV